MRTRILTLDEIEYKTLYELAFNELSRTTCDADLLEEHERAINLMKKLIDVL